MMALASDHLELAARLGSRHRRRRPPLPRRARRNRWRAGRLGGGRGRGRAFLTGVDARWQRSTAKAFYSRNGRSASWAAPGTYLAREGAQREGGKGRGFSAEREGIDLTATLRGWQRAGDARLWKFIVSPEHADRLDLKAHARALVSHMERDLGTRLEWVAIDHYNTDNPHVHLLVRGRDARGQALQIHPDYLKQGIRRRSQDLATQVLGYRSEREIVQSRGQTVERLRFTEIDRALIRHGGTRGLGTIDGPTPKAPAARAFRQQELRRLQMLEDLGLAEKVWTRTWRLSPQLETALRQAQLSGDIIKARARHQARLSDPRAARDSDPDRDGDRDHRARHRHGIGRRAPRPALLAGGEPGPPPLHPAAGGRPAGARPRPAPHRRRRHAPRRGDRERGASHGGDPRSGARAGSGCRYLGAVGAVAGIVLLSIWATTQLTAYRLHFHPMLGAPLVTVGSPYRELLSPAAILVATLGPAA